MWFLSFLWNFSSSFLQLFTLILGKNVSPKIVAWIRVKYIKSTILDVDVNASAAIDATKIADGSVTSAEFQYINTLSSNAQTQIDTKATKGFSIAMGVALG